MLRGGRKGMHLILVLVGTVLAFAGALLVLYAVPVIDVAAAALFISGIFAIVGALILFALAVLARGIDRIAERLEVQPSSAPSVPPVATVAREEVAPRAARSEPTPIAAASPAAPPAEPVARTEKRPSALSAWLNRASPAVAGKKMPPVVALEPPAAKADAPPPAWAAEEPPPPPPLVAPAPVEPTIVAPPIAAAPPPAPPPPAPAQPSPPPLAPTPPAVAPAPAAPIIPRVATPVRPVLPPAPAPASPAATVYKSGVIDGMAYTLFMDGAIEAELPQGWVRFASVEELQKYLTSRG
jgi:hypothetical protein